MESNALVHWGDFCKPHLPATGLTPAVSICRSLFAAKIVGGQGKH